MEVLELEADVEPEAGEELEAEEELEGLPPVVPPNRGMLLLPNPPRSARSPEDLG